MMPFNNNDEGIGASSWVNENASGTPLEILVKTNYELILSLHKQLAKTEQNINRKIVSLFHVENSGLKAFLKPEVYRKMKKW